MTTVNTALDLLAWMDNVRKTALESRRKILSNHIETGDQKHLTEALQLEMQLKAIVSLITKIQHFTPLMSPHNIISSIESNISKDIASMSSRVTHLSSTVLSAGDSLDIASELLVMHLQEEVLNSVKECLSYV